MARYSLRAVLITACLAIATGVAPAAGPIQLPPAVQAAAQTITRDTLEAPIRFLASDVLEGRGPATRGDVLTRTYLASELQSLGYKPGAPDGSWEQPFDIVGITATVPETWTFTASGKQVALRYSEEFMAVSGLQSASVAIDRAPLVFIGYGIEAPEYQWDDFKGADLKGKILVMLNNDPDWDPKLFEGARRLYYGRWSYKYESGARHGAAGVIVIHTTASAGYPWQVVQSSWSGPQFELPDSGEPRLQIRGWTTEGAMRKLMSAAGQDLNKLVAAARSRKFKPVPLGIETSLRIESSITKSQTANVAGLLEGSDPALKSEVVVYTAHHDHLGMSAEGQGDPIYNGALDNGVGCAQLLAIARAFAGLAEKPRRSVLILFVAAEEQGLIGSRYYALHPSFASGKIAANLNYDGGNVWGPTRDITLVSSGKSSLDAIVQAVAAMQGRVVKPDQFPDRGYFYRSDQFSFAKIGVPAIYTETGTDFIGHPPGWGKERIEDYEAKRYHQPSDEFDPGWNYDGMIEDARLGLYSGWIIAQSEQMPVWNPGDEFEAVRKKALAAH